MSYDLVVIGCSLGGLRALQRILSAMSRRSLTPMVIVQHRDPDINTGEILGTILQKSSSLKLHEAEDKMRIEPGFIYLAPADYHLLIDDHRLILSTELPVSYARPSIDVAFETASRSYGSGLIGVILTGTGSDGAQGARQVEERGGLIVIEDPKSAESAAMPNAALAVTRNPRVLPLEEIGPYLCRLDGGAENLNVARKRR